jgi:SMC interacting uncharacterized protein involved in chromosome segregation
MPYFIIIFAIIAQENFMEKIMSALQRLQSKIETWCAEHEALKSENAQLKSQLNNASNTQGELDTLKRELAEKDVEIEKIIAQVEALLE